MNLLKTLRKCSTTYSGSPEFFQIFQTHRYGGISGQKMNFYDFRIFLALSIDNYSLRVLDKLTNFSYKSW